MNLLLASKVSEIFMLNFYASFFWELKSFICKQRNKLFLAPGIVVSRLVLVIIFCMIISIMKYFKYFW